MFVNWHCLAEVEKPVKFTSAWTMAQMTNVKRGASKLWNYELPV